MFARSVCACREIAFDCCAFLFRRCTLEKWPPPACFRLQNAPVRSIECFYKFPYVRWANPNYDPSISAWIWTLGLVSARVDRGVHRGASARCVLKNPPPLPSLFLPFPAIPSPIFLAHNYCWLDCHSLLDTHMKICQLERYDLALTLCFKELGSKYNGLCINS